MKKKILLVMLLALGAALPLWAVTVWFSSVPSTSVNSGVPYYVEATTSMPGGAGSIYIYKNGVNVAGNGNSNYITTSVTTSDTGPKVVEFHAVATDSVHGGATADAWAYVTINAANSAPTGWMDFASGSVPVNGAMTTWGWATDPEMGAPITRVDLLIDGNDVGDASLGGDRQDVANAFGRPDYRYSGFWISVNIGALSVGNHTVAMRAVDNQGASTVFGSTTFAVTNNTPSITLSSPAGQTVAQNTTLTITSTATDPDGNITSHNLDIQRPDGTWNFQGGFAYGEPFIGGPVGSGSSSTRSANFTFNIAGTWYVRSWVQDGAGNSLHSATVAITVLDGVAPSVPAGLSASSVIPTSFTLSWSPSSDNVGVTAYEVFRDGSSLGTTGSTSLGISGLAQGTTYAMTVRARDAAGNWSASSSPLSVTTPRANQATYVSHSVPSTLQAGATASVSVTMKNSGWSTWNSDATPHRLGSQNTPDMLWGINRVELGGSVVPGASNTFNFNITAPSTPGTYYFQWKMVEDGVEWFGAATPNVAISVPAQDNPSLTPQLLDAAGSPLPVNGSNQAVIKLNSQVKIRLIASSPASAVSTLYWRLIRPGSVQGTAPSAEWTWAGSSWQGQTSTSGNPTWTSQLFTADTAGVWDLWYHASTASAAPWGSQTPWTGDNFGWRSVHLPDLLVDGAAPSVPSGLAAASVQPTSFTLNWTASTDNIGVTGYEVFRNGTSIGTSTGTTFNVTGLTQGTTYAMTVRARDLAGNWSAQNTALNVQTTDTGAPSVPTALNATAITSTSFTLNWTASTDNIGVTGYEVFRNGTSIGTTAGTAFNVTGLTQGTTYTMTVRARDLAANWSAQSSPGLGVQTTDTAAPSVPTGLNATAITSTSFTLNWTASTDNIGVTGYEVFRNGTSIGTAAGTAFNVTGLTQGTTYTMTVRARDLAANWSAQSSPGLGVRTTDTAAPSVPTGLNATAITSTTFTLNWTASTDNVGVTGYEVFRNGTSIGTPTGTSYNATGLAQGTTYAMTVRARDASNNWSPQSSPALNVQTLNPPVWTIPFLTGFESSDNYVVGALDGQLGWTATGAVTVTNTSSASGAQSALLSGATTPATLTRTFPTHAANPIVFTDFSWKLRAGADESSSPKFSVLNAAQIAVVQSGSTGLVRVFNGNGSGSGTWQVTPASVSLDANGVTTSWVRITLRLDYTARKYDLYVNGVLAAININFTTYTQNTIGSWTFTGHASASTSVDDVFAVFEDPVAVDTDRDGMPDSWETPRGLNATVNDRDGDLDGDGVTNIAEYFLGTNPNNADSNGNGIPDGQEIDTDRDGMPDWWELMYGLNPFSAADGALDPDGDGFTNAQEYARGSKPNFRLDGIAMPGGYDAVLPTPTGQYQGLKTTDWTLTPLVTP